MIPLQWLFLFEWALLTGSALRRKHGSSFKLNSENARPFLNCSRHCLETESCYGFTFTVTSCIIYGDSPSFEEGEWRTAEVAYAKDAKETCSAVATESVQEGSASTGAVIPPFTTTAPTTAAPAPPPCCVPGGVWSEWETTGFCLALCGGCSTARRKRTCLSEASGCPCDGEAEGEGPCGIDLCKLLSLHMCCAGLNRHINHKTGALFCGTKDVPTDPSPVC